MALTDINSTLKNIVTNVSQLITGFTNYNKAVVAEFEKITGGGANPPFESGTANFVATPNFPGSTSEAEFFGVLGSMGTPDTTDDPLVIFQKWGIGVADENPTVYISAWKTGDASNTSAASLFVETVDNAGWSGSGTESFIEGIRTHAILNVGAGSLGSAQALVAAVGDNGNTGHRYMQAIEADVFNGTRLTPSIFNNLSFDCCFIGTSSGSLTIDAVFCVNPFQVAPAIRGFYNPIGGLQSGTVAFVNDDTSVNTIAGPGQNFLVDGSGNVTTQASLGYGPSSVGVGGAVTQTGSINSAVTINKITGTITTVSNSFTGLTAVAFTVNNTFVTATSSIILTPQTTNCIAVAAVTTNSFVLTIFPFATGTTSVVINFTVINSVNT